MTPLICYSEDDTEFDLLAHNESVSTYILTDTLQHCCTETCGRIVADIVSVNELLSFHEMHLPFAFVPCRLI
jgi:hypothetical protein